MWPSGRLGEPDFVAYEDLSRHQCERLGDVYVAVLRAVAEHFGAAAVEVQRPLAVGRPPEEIAHRYPDGTRVGVEVAAELIRHFATGGRTQWSFAIAERALIAFGDDPILYVASDEDLGPLVGDVVGGEAMVHAWPDAPRPYERAEDEEYVLTAADDAFWARVRRTCGAFPGPHLLQEVWAPPAGVAYYDLAENSVDDIAESLKPGSLVRIWFTVPRYSALEIEASFEGLTSEEIDELDVRLRLLPTSTSRLEHGLVDGEDLLTEVRSADANPGARYCLDPDFDTSDAWRHAHLTAVMPWRDNTVKPRWVQDREWLEADLRPPKAPR